MRRSFIALPVLASAFILSVLSACTSRGGEDIHIAGTATDTENTIADIGGVVVRTDGSKAANISVRMARVSTDSTSLAAVPFVEVRTDSTGAFAFDSVLADTFQLAVIDSIRGEISYLPSTTVDAPEFENISLKKAASVNGMLLNRGSGDSSIVVGSHFSTYVPGTPFGRSVFSGESFSMLIPAGKVRLVFCPGDPEIVTKLSESGVSDSLIYRSWDMGDKTVKEGESVDVGPFIWSLSPEVAVDSLVKEQEVTSRISGAVLCKNGKACKGVEVQLVTDLYGFSFREGDSLVFKSETVTDSAGRWYLPVPSEVPYDSFRVEYRKIVDNVVSETGLSKYMKAKSIKDLKDTLNLGETTLRRASKMVSSVRVVLDSSSADSQSNNCTVNSVVIGLKGTTHFVRDVTCNLITMSDLPDGEQELILYTGDPKVVSTLQNVETPMRRYVSQIDVNLPEGWTLDQQGMTYTPPVLK